MSRGLVTSGPHFFTSSAILRLLAAGQAVRTMEQNPTPAASVRAVLDRRNVQPDAHVRFIAADRDDAGRLEPRDAVAGCEFVDDRIRLRE
jgi:hypothetical protein